MKKIVSCILVLVMIFLYTGIDIAAYCAVNPVQEAADNAVNSDDVFKGRAEINDKLEKENKELQIGLFGELITLKYLYNLGNTNIIDIKLYLRLIIEFSVRIIIDKILAKIIRY